MTNKKIVFIANTDWYLFRFRLDLCRRLLSDGWNVVLISPRGDYHLKLINEGLVWFDWRLSRRGLNPFAELVSIVRLVALLKKINPDIVHNFTHKAVLYGSISSLFFPKVEVINTIAGLGYLFLSNNFFVKCYKRLLLMFYKKLFSRDNIFVIFENQADQKMFIQENIVDSDKSSVVNGAGVDLEKFRPVNKTNKYINIIFPGRMLFDKGVGDFIESIKLIKDRFSLHNVNFILVGDIDRYNPAHVPVEVIRNWEQNGLIKWWGFKEDMVSVYNDANIIILPSYREGLSTTLIEAAASGLPIITTDIPGCNDVVLDNFNGLLVPIKDPEALSEAILKLVNDKNLRSSLGAKSRVLAEKNFSNEIIISKIKKIYQDRISQIKI